MTTSLKIKGLVVNSEGIADVAPDMIVVDKSSNKIYTDNGVEFAPLATDKNNGLILAKDKVKLDSYPGDGKAVSAVSADTAKSADKLTKPVNLSIEGFITGAATAFDGSGDIKLNTTRAATKIVISDYNTYTTPGYFQTDALEAGKNAPDPESIHGQGFFEVNVTGGVVTQIINLVTAPYTKATRTSTDEGKTWNTWISGDNSSSSKHADVADELSASRNFSVNGALVSDAVAFNGGQDVKLTVKFNVPTITDAFADLLKKPDYYVTGKYFISTPQLMDGVKTSAFLDVTASSDATHITQTLTFTDYQGAVRRRSNDKGATWSTWDTTENYTRIATAKTPIDLDGEDILSYNGIVSFSDMASLKLKKPLTLPIVNTAAVSGQVVITRHSDAASAVVQTVYVHSPAAIYIAARSYVQNGTWSVWGVQVLATEESLTGAFMSGTVSKQYVDATNNKNTITLNDKKDQILYAVATATVKRGAKQIPFSVPLALGSTVVFDGPTNSSISIDGVNQNQYHLANIFVKTDEKTGNTVSGNIIWLSPLEDDETVLNIHIKVVGKVVM